MVFATLVLASAPAFGRESSPPVIQVDNITPPPVVHFSVPRYSLTAVERETVAACLVLEAASQGDYGMRGVMSVIRNRARSRPELFAGTVLQPKQVSALNRLTAGRETLAQVISRAKRDRMWNTAIGIVDAAAGNLWHDPTAGATHYTRSGEHNRWTRRLAATVIIGAHSFYR